MAKEMPVNDRAQRWEERLEVIQRLDAIETGLMNRD